jgi:hypothetical protein
MLVYQTDQTYEVRSEQIVTLPYLASLIEFNFMKCASWPDWIADISSTLYLKNKNPCM